ncbi:MAG: SpoIIE family protein phosphatase [Anaerolineae bacterium]|nr:SpoIIE family protein phosphatase [Anaerolineae bacterium]
MEYFLDVFSASLNKTGEELCGDKVKVLKTPNTTIVVLSDGLGSGVKANILATLTAEIIVNMLRADIPLNEVISTVIGTLPICKVRQIAYATFTAIEIDHRTNGFKIVNFDNPSVFYYRKGKRLALTETEEKILDRPIRVSEGTLKCDDFLGIISDGVLHAGLGTAWNFGWGWDNVAKHLEGAFLRLSHGAKPVVKNLIAETKRHYSDQIGDDATCVGIYARQSHKLMILTGPPLDPTTDQQHVQRLLDFDGTRVVCGGTTGNMVAEYLGEVIETDLLTLRKDVPPIGWLSQVDLLTEGIITMSRALDYMRDCEGEENYLPRDRNGGVLLARELLRADSIFFLVGQKINEFYQSPLLPGNLSLRRKLIEEIARFLTEHHKDVQIEYC